MLLVLIQKVVKNLFVEESNSLEIVARTRLKADYFIDEPVRLMREVCDILLALYLLLNIGRIISDL